MNIKQAKEEIVNSVKAYLQKDAVGEYVIPTNRQRPILLIGPPGIGKSAIMTQVAEECQIALVSYTMTHHTRETAIGQSYVEKVFYNKEAYSVTQYTLSEIIASIYNKINLSGISEGILFIDEINCVSESLAPTMLQLLQSKVFGNHKLPEGWIIVAAGNPREYNNAARSFDVATLDRVKNVNITPDLDVWKEYAYKKRIHEAIVAFLTENPEQFYQVIGVDDNVQFVTARGWEDMSDIIYAYERLGIAINYELIVQYVQYPELAMQFAQYYEKYTQLLDNYDIEAIMRGRYSNYALLSDITALSVILSSRLAKQCYEACWWNMYIAKLMSINEASVAIYLKSADNLRCDVSKVTDNERIILTRRINGNIIPEDERKAIKAAIDFSEHTALIYGNTSEHIESLDEAFKDIRVQIAQEIAKRDEFVNLAKSSYENTRVYINDSIYDGELNDNYYVNRLLKEV